MSVAQQFDSRRPGAAYIHVPFCSHRCGYCNFAVVAGRHDLIKKYLQAVDIELSWLNEPSPVNTLYVGGGTPTELSPGELDSLFGKLRTWFPLEERGELTCEANPADLNADMLACLSSNGVNRISLGVQSMNSEKLQLLERNHRCDDVERTYRQVCDQVENVSVDLIFGVPGESIDDWKDDLRTIIDLGPVHISTYGLTFERGTRFWSRREKRELIEVGDRLQREMFETAIDHLTAAGYEHYEVSNHAQDGWRSQHNQTYWQGKSYYGIGPGAARYIDGRRSVNHRSTTTYLKRVLHGVPAIAETERLSPEERARERLVLGMRMLQGVDGNRFRKETGYAIEELVGKRLDRLLELNLVTWRGPRFRLTREGLMVSDAIWTVLLNGPD